MLEEEQDLLGCLSREWAFVEQYDEAKAVLDRATALQLSEHYPSCLPDLQRFRDELLKAERVALARQALRSAVDRVNPSAIHEAVATLQRVEPQADTKHAVEVIRLWEEEQTWVPALLEALSSGELGEREVHIEPLRSALREASPQTKRGEAINAYASGVLALRTAVLAREHEHLEKALEVLDGMQQRGDLERFELSSGVIGLYRNHLHRVSIIADLSAALQRGQVTGAVGDLQTGGVDIDQLEADVRDAKALRCAEPDAVQAIALAEAVLMARKAALANDWATAVELPELGSEELELVRAEGVDQRVYAAAMAAVEAVESGGDVVGFLDEAARVQLNTGVGRKTIDALQRLEVVERIARAAVDADAVQTEEILPLLEEEKASCVAKTAARKLLEKEAVLGVQHGAADGPRGAVRVSKSDVDALEERVQRAERLEAVIAPPTLSPPLLTLRRLFSLRQALLAAETGTDTDWQTLSSLVDQAQREPLMPAASAEVERMKAEVLERRAAAQLRQALVTGCIGFGKGKVDPAPLQAAITAAQIAESSIVRQLMKSAEVVLALRSAVVNGEHEAAGSVLDDARFVRLVAEAEAEVARARQEWEEEDVCRGLIVAVDCGAFSGEIEAIETAGVELGALDTAIAKATRVQLRLDASKKLLRLAKVVRKLRECVVEGRWAHLVTLVDDARRQGFFEQSHALEELQLAQYKVEDEDVKQKIVAALAQHGVQGTVGALVVEDVKLGPLLETISAIDSTSTLRTPGAERLFASAKHIADLREAVFAGPDWAAVASTLASNKTEIAPEALAEHELLKAELADRRLLEQIEAAIEHGRVDGDVGELDISRVSFDALEDLLRREAQLSLVTSRCLQAWAVLRPLRGLRAAVLEEAVDWEGQVQRSLAALDAQPLPKAAEAEVKLVRLEAENQIAQHRLVRAVRREEEMDAALANARRVVARTVKLNLLVASAELVKGIWDNAAGTPRDWDALQVLLKQHRVQILPATPVGDRTQPADFPRVAPAAHAAVQEAVDQLRENICSRRLGQGLAEGRCVGVVGALNVSAIFTNTLEDALDLAARCELRLPAATKRLLCVARTTLALRNGIKSDEPDVTLQALADALLQALDGWDHPEREALVEEAQLVAEEARNRTLVADLRSAMRRGAMRGADADSPELDALERALHAEKTREPLSAEAAELVGAAQLLLRVRSCLKRRDMVKLKAGSAGSSWRGGKRGGGDQCT